MIYQDNACKELDIQNDTKNNYKNSLSDDHIKNQLSEGLYEKNLVIFIDFKFICICIFKY